MHLLPALAAALSLVAFSPAFAQGEKRPAITVDLPHFATLTPKPEQPVFAVCSKQGMRILLSRDDGKTWRQVFVATEDKEDGGWHGSFAVYGMAYTDGVIGAFAGWGKPANFVGSVDGENWGYLHGTENPLAKASAWSAAAGKGVMLTSASMWEPFARYSVAKGWSKVAFKPLLEGGKTHHMIAGYGEFGPKGAFVVVGDEGHVLYSHDLGETFAHATLPAEAGKGQDALAFGNGVFLCSFPQAVARSADGGKTWTMHPHGVTGGLSWRGLSFVKGEFWLTSKNGKSARRSKDGITWSDLPAGTPGGKFIEGETGTLINVERGRYDIRRSADGGKSWQTVFTAPAQDVTWSLSFGVYGKVKAPGR